MVNLFGEEELDVTQSILRQRFVEPPFSILDTRQAEWQERKRTWKKLGIRPEIVNENNTKTFNISEWASEKADKDMDTTDCRTADSHIGKRWGRRLYAEGACDRRRR